MADLQYNIRPLQMEVLRIFKVFAEICERHSLRYYAAYGTALGAIRHKGFIPWDDDFDVVLPRKDYNKFVDVVSAELPENMKFYRGGETLCAPIYFSKILNIEEGIAKRMSELTGMVISESPYIDIFVLENVPERVLDFRNWWIERRLWRIVQLWRYPATGRCASVKGLRLQLSRMVGLLLNRRYRKTENNEDMVRVFDEWSASIPESLHVVEPAFFRMKESRMLERALFEPARKIPFEDVTIRVAAKVEEILCRYYGNYMQLPPENERVPPHILKLLYEGHV